MTTCVGGRQLLGGLVAREIAMLAIVNVVNLTVVPHKRWQPSQRASDTLLLLNALSGTLRCGRVERCAMSEALGRLEGLHGRQ